ncbi:hypothetical protein Tco_0902751 [Tanacetum coccineum]
MSRQCPKPKRKIDATWFRDNVLLVEAQGNGKVLNEEELKFLADLGIAEGPVTQSVITHNAAFQADDFGCQSHLVNYPENEITSDSNIIPYSHYLPETQNAAVQDTNSSAQQDAMILSVFEQLSHQEKEDKNIDKEIALKKKVKELDNIKAQQSRPMLYDGNVIPKESNVISIADSELILMLKEENQSKMLLKQSDPMVLENKVNITPVNYAILNQLSEYFGKHFVPQQKVSAEQDFHLQMSNPSNDSSDASPVKVVVPSELPKERITPTALSEVFDQMEIVVQQYSIDIRCLEIDNKQALNANDRLLEQIISQDIMNIAVNSAMDLNAYANVNKDSSEMCNKCLELKAELFKQHNMVEKDVYNKLSKIYSQLEQHCISLELAMQLNQEIFQKNNTFVNQTKLTFDQLFELNNLTTF